MQSQELGFGHARGSFETPKTLSVKVQGMSSPRGRCVSVKLMSCLRPTSSTCSFQQASPWRNGRSPTAPSDAALSTSCKPTPLPTYGCLIKAPASRTCCVTCSSVCFLFSVWLCFVFGPGFPVFWQLDPLVACSLPSFWSYSPLVLRSSGPLVSCSSGLPSPFCGKWECHPSLDHPRPIKTNRPPGEHTHTRAHTHTHTHTHTHPVKAGWENLDAFALLTLHKLCTHGLFSFSTEHGNMLPNSFVHHLTH